MRWRRPGGSTYKGLQHWIHRCVLHFLPLGVVLDNFQLILIAAVDFTLAGVLFTILKKFPTAVVMRLPGACSFVKICYPEGSKESHPCGFRRIHVFRQGQQAYSGHDSR